MKGMIRVIVGETELGQVDFKNVKMKVLITDQI